MSETSYALANDLSELFDKYGIKSIETIEEPILQIRRLIVRCWDGSNYDYDCNILTKKGLWEDD